MTLLDADERERRAAVGEDTWELLATIEESFGVPFPAYETLLGKTVGELAELIAGKSPYTQSGQCLSSVTFYRLRRAFSELFDIPREVIRPAASLHALLPWSTRRVHWRKLQEHLGLTLPSLNYPGWLLTALLMLSLAIAVAISIAWSTAIKSISGSAQSTVWIGVQSLFFWIWAAVLVMKWSVPVARAFPRGCETFGDLVKTILAGNFAAIASRYGGTTIEEIATLLRYLIAVELGMDPSDISSDTRIPGDLNID